MSIRKSNLHAEVGSMSSWLVHLDVAAVATFLEVDDMVGVLPDDISKLASHKWL